MKTTRRDLITAAVALAIAAQLRSRTVRAVQPFTGKGRPLAPKITKIGCVGDSNTEGVVVTRSFPQEVSDLKGPGLYRTDNLGVTGDHLSSMLTRWTAVASGYDALVLLGGTNDLPAGTSPATLYSTIQSIVAVAGPTIHVVCTVPPGAFITGANETNRQTLNTSIRGTAGITVVDVDALLRDPGTPSQLFAAYNSGDGTHWNQAGNDLVATNVAAAIP